MPAPRVRHPLIESVDRRIEKEAQRRPKYGTVQKKHGSTLSVRVRGSAKLLENVAVIGDIAHVKTGDTVLLNWDKKRPRALIPGSSAAAPRRSEAQGTGAAGASQASSISIADADGYFTGTSVEAALKELARAVKEASTIPDFSEDDAVSPPAPIKPTGLDYKWETNVLELWWLHTGARKDFRIQIYDEQGGTLLRTAYSNTTGYIWGWDAQLQDTGLAAGDPSVYVEVATRASDDTVSAVDSKLCTNDPPLAPTMTYYWVGPGVTATLIWPAGSDIKEGGIELEKGSF